MSVDDQLGTGLIIGVLFTSLIWVVLLFVICSGVSESEHRASEARVLQHFYPCGTDIREEKLEQEDKLAKEIWVCSEGKWRLQQP